MTYKNKFNYSNWGGEVETQHDPEGGNEIRLYIYHRESMKGIQVEIGVLDAESLIETLRQAVETARKER